MQPLAPQSRLTEDTSSLNCLRDVNTRGECCLSALNGPKGQLHVPSVSGCIRIIKSAEVFPRVRWEVWWAGRGSNQQACLVTDLCYHQNHLCGHLWFKSRGNTFTRGTDMNSSPPWFLKFLVTKFFIDKNGNYVVKYFGLQYRGILSLFHLSVER